MNNPDQTWLSGPNVPLLIWALFLLLLACPAQAQIDPDPDGLGIYFDTEASVVNSVAGTGDAVQAYLIGTRLSQPGNLGYWQARLCPEAGAEILGTPYGSYNYGSSMPGDSCWSCVAMYLDPPLPAQEITLLASLTILVWQDIQSIALFINEGPFYQVYGSPDEFPFYPSSGSCEEPVAVINSPGLIHSQRRTFDQVKALFR